MRRKKFDIYKFLMEADDHEMEQNQDPNQVQAPPPPGAPQAEPPQNPEMPPAQMSKAKPKNALSDVVGSSISNVSFRSVPNGGELKIKLSDSHVPLTISWVGSKVYASKPNGTTVMLSTEE
jgi:hypothetical protein